MNSFYNKPDEILPDDFGYALNLVNVDAVVGIMPVSYTHLTLPTKA